MKTAERLRARELRSERGLSIKQIARTLGVAQSSVSVWVRDIELSLAQRQALAARNPALNPTFEGGRARARRALAQRLDHQAEGRALVSQRGSDFAAGYRRARSESRR
jgi:transposase-like protein